jgi:hypothetical protein
VENHSIILHVSHFPLKPFSTRLYIANIYATGVRKYPDPIGWVAAMPVEDKADVGSFWSGYDKDDPNLKRPRRVDETIGTFPFKFLFLTCNWIVNKSHLISLSLS